MADTKPTTAEKAVITGDHDRVASLSIRADGTLDQTNPEIIGDKDAALEVTKEQFRQMAVSAVDADKRAELGLTSGPDEPGPDKVVDELRAAHEAAEKQGEKAAEAVVKSLT